MRAIFHRAAAMLLLSMLAPGAAVSEEAPDFQDCAHALLQAAIDRCKPGGELLVPPGTHTITRPLRLQSNMLFRGESAETTVIRFTGAKPGAMMDLSECEYVEVSHLTLDGANNPNAAQGIHARDARRLSLRHLVIRNFTGGDGFGPHGIFFQGDNPTRERGVTDSVIDSCRIENIAVDAPFGCGIRFSWGSSRNRVTRTTIHNTGRGGVFGDNGSTHLVIQGNTVTGSGGEGLGIEVWGGCDQSVIEDNKIDHWLSIGGSDYCSARRNTVSGGPGVYKFCGIEAIGSWLVITDNVVDGGQQIGLSVSNRHLKDYVYWGGNQVRRCGQWGAQFQGEESGASRHYFYNCSFADMPENAGPAMYPGAEGHGFRFNGDTHSVTMEACSFVNNARLGIQVTGENVDRLRFVDCVFRGNKGAAVAGLSQDTSIAWENCVFADNGDDTPPSTRTWEGMPPKAAFQVPATVKTGEPVTFDNTSMPGVEEIAAALWDFDHGPPVTDMTPVHVFDRPGRYTVTLIVWDRSGRAARLSQIIEVL